MRSAACLVWLALLWLAFGGHAAHADERSVSYSTWIVSDDGVMLRYLMPAREAQRLTGTALPLLTVSRLGDYVLRRTQVEAGGHDCPSIDQGYDIGHVDPLQVGRDLYGFEIVFHCDSPGALVLHNHALFDAVPGHVDFARIERHGRFVQQLFDGAHQELRLAAADPMQAAGAARYLPLGIHHVISSADRLCALLGLLLLARRRRDLGWAMAGLAVGYAASLAVALGQWVAPDIGALDAGLGFVIAWIAVAWLALERGGARVSASVCAAGLAGLALVTALARGLQPAMVLAGAATITAGSLPVLARAIGRWTFWLALPAAVGFLDGFVLPAQLQPLRLPASGLWPMLAGYDLGALGAQLLLLAAGAALFAWRTRHALLRRPIIDRLAASALGGLGAFWLLSRLYL